MKPTGKGMGMKPPVKAAKPASKPVTKYKDGGKVLKTETMPSGAQQYTRGDTASARLETINGVAKAATRRKDWNVRGKAVDGFIDEAKADRKKWDAAQRARGDGKRR